MLVVVLFGKVRDEVGFTGGTVIFGTVDDVVVETTVEEVVGETIVVVSGTVVTGTVVESSGGAHVPPFL